MPADQHHRSKKVRYDLVLVPKDDAGQAKSVRLTPWQIYLSISGVVLFLVGSVLAILIYTPVGPMLPIENPELENRYGKELLSLNQRMESMMEQLVELRDYNVMLRKALGENVVVTDSGVAILGAARPSQSGRVQAEQLPERAGVQTPEQVRSLSQPSFVRAVVVEKQTVVFPVIIPTEGYITRGFIPDQRHYGIDVAGKTGTIVNAAADGHVIFAGWTSDDGNKVILTHAGGFLTVYKHNRSLMTSVNAFARRGEPIAQLGNTGQTSAGPHLHFEVWKDGTPVDPAQYILNFNF